jgi:hypothetical protein
VRTHLRQTMKARTTILLLILSLLLFNCEEEDPIIDEELAIDSCTLEPNYVSTEAWQEVYIDLPNETMMSFPNTYTTSLGSLPDTWGFDADRQDNQVYFRIELGWGTDPAIIIKDPLPDTLSRGLTEKSLVYSFGDSSQVMGVIYYSCYTNEWINHFRKAGTFFIKKDSIYEEKIHFGARRTEWDEVVTILSTVRVE